MSDYRDEGPSFLYEPQVPDLRALIRDMLSGTVVIPRFQRRFRWEAKHRVDLLKSIVRGIPIGTILVWRAQEGTYRTFDSIGPHRMPAPQPGGLVSYVLDGHQRLTTLLSALVAPPAVESATTPDDTAWAIHYDLAGDPPEFVILGVGENPSPTMFPLHAALDGRSVLAFQRSLQRRDDADVLIARCDEVVARLRDCRVPIIPLSTRNPLVAKDSFVRMNRPIAVMSELDLVNAARSGEGDELDERIASLREQVLAPVGWAGASDDLLLDTAKLLLGLDLQDTDPRALARRIDEREEILNDAVHALRLTADFLQSINVPAPALVPYEQLAAMLARALFTASDPTVPALRGALERWFWHALYSVGDAGFNVTAARKASMLLSAACAAPEARDALPSIAAIRPLPTRVRLDHARPRALLLHWIREYRRELPGRAMDFRHVSTSPDTEVFLAPLFDGSGQPLPSPKQRSSFGNRILVRGAESVTMRDDLLRAIARDPHELRAQLFDESALRAFEQSDLDGVVGARNLRLATLERAHLAALGLISDEVPAARVAG